jgi:hypothetical protein
MSTAVAFPRSETASRLLLAGLSALAVYQLALGAFMAIAPHAFFKSLGPFYSFNSHYIRDLATYNLALGAGLALAVRNPGWRVPLLAVTTIQFALHSANHLLDIDRAHPAWTGYLDFASLAFATLLIGGLLALAGMRR